MCKELNCNIRTLIKKAHKLGLKRPKKKRIITPEFRNMISAKVKDAMNQPKCKRKMKKHKGSVYLTDKIWTDIDFLKTKFRLKSRNKAIELAINRVMKF
jgi:hypothetical protein